MILLKDLTQRKPAAHKLFHCLDEDIKMIKRMDHINLVVSNLERAKAFFLNLGFEEIDHAYLSGERFSLVTGLENSQAKYVALALPGAETNLELIQYINPPGTGVSGSGQANQIGLRHIAFAVDDIHTVVQRLKTNGVRFQSEIQTWKQSGKQIVYLYGPDGILLELAQYPDP
jgi:catechol 2,3-dioxygenase-like lactoylglutathione lyase family enzyme